MKSRSIVLVTVSGPEGREDVAMAADVPVFRLMPALVDLVAAGAHEGTASGIARWQLRNDDRLCPPSRTLIEVGVVDGNELTLTTGASGRHG